MPREGQTITIGTLRDAVAQALAAAFPGEAAGEDRHAHVVIFAGEGETAGSALRAAIGNIRALCDDHQCRPAVAVADGVVRTDDGVRIWGTLECVLEQ